jgi:leucyl-tRNA synthetase
MSSGITGHSTPLIYERWPLADKAAMAEDVLEIVVQVNGKLRGRVSVAADADRDAIEQLALADENVRRFVANNTIRKVIVLPARRLVNIVV